MTPVKYVLRSLNVLNGLLLAMIAAFVYVAVLPVLSPAARMSLPPVQGTPAPTAETATTPRNLSPGEYAMISELNLFHPERKIPPEKPVEKAVPRPDIFLHGTLITSEGSFAFVEDRKAPPPSTGGRDKRQLTLRKGATVGGYVLSEVEADRIVLSKGDDRVVVMLNDREKRRVAERTTATPPASSAVTSAPSAAASLPKPTSSPHRGAVRSPREPPPRPRLRRRPDLRTEPPPISKPIRCGDRESGDPASGRPPGAPWSRPGRSCRRHSRSGTSSCVAPRFHEGCHFEKRRLALATLLSGFARRDL